MNGQRMNCSLFRSLREGYFKQMFYYCKAWGLKYVLIDSYRDILEFIICGIFGHRIIHREEFTHSSYCGRCKKELLID